MEKSIRKVREESIAIAIGFFKYTAKLILIETDLIVSVVEREKKFIQMQSRWNSVHFESEEREREIEERNTTFA